MCVCVCVCRARVRARVCVCFVPMPKDICFHWEGNVVVFDYTWEGNVVSDIWRTMPCTIYLEISCFVSNVGHLSAKSNNFNCSDGNRILGK